MVTIKYFWHGNWCLVQVLKMDKEDNDNFTVVKVFGLHRLQLSFCYLFLHKYLTETSSARVHTPNIHVINYVQGS